MSIYYIYILNILNIYIYIIYIKNIYLYIYPKMFVRLRSKPQRRTVKQSTAQAVPARCDQLGPPGLL